MILKHCLRTCIFLSVLLQFAGNSFSQHSDKRPNIIYIMTDDLGYADLSCYGRKDYQTPHLDKLASEGMKFTNAYAAAPVCTPTRTAFMTGRYPSRSSIGLLEPWVPARRDSTIGLPTNQPNLAQLLKEAGYETALIGKWHLGVIKEFSPVQKGFDYFFGNKTGALDYISHRGDGGRLDLYENNNVDSSSGYMTELIGAKARWYIQQSHKKPFFLSLQFTAPHWPWQGPTDKALPASMPMNAKLMSAEGTKEIYVAMMKSLDEEIGKVMQTLQETGLANNTVVIFTSDNGGEKFSDMGPFSKMKMTVWEGGIRVPAFVRWPGRVTPGSVSEQSVITMDWTSTILSLAAVKNIAALKLDGNDLSPALLKQAKPQERSFYWRITQRKNQHAMLDGDWKYIHDEEGEYLFNIKTDPGERNNKKDQHPDVFNKLKQKYLLWEKQVLKPLPL